MIVLDTSAIMIILLDEPEAPACIATSENHGSPIISAGALVTVRYVANAYEQLGQGLHARQPLLDARPRNLTTA